MADFKLEEGKIINIRQPLSQYLDILKYDPTAINRLILNNLEDTLEKKVDIVDPTNPFIFLLEACSVTASTIINDNLNNLRNQYPSLAENVKELYNHMIDIDYVNRFAVPSKTYIYFMFKKLDLIQNAINVPNTNIKRVTIPRNSYIRVNDELDFSLEYPINIDILNSDNILIKWDLSIPSPFKKVEDFIFPYSIITDQGRDDWIRFNVPLSQFSTNSHNFTISPSSFFRETVNIEDSFFYARVWMKNNNTNNKWKELKTTYSDIVYDPEVPTALLRYLGNRLELTIPPTYITSNKISGNIRLDVYTTKGKIYKHLNSTPTHNFIITYKSLDPEEENDFTNAIKNISTTFYSSEIVSGGREPLSFKQLKERVINNSLGPLDYPITEFNLKTKLENNGFDLYKASDVLYDRIFIAHKFLPTIKELNIEDLESSINITKEEIVTTIKDLKSTSTVYVNNKDQTITILAGTIFKIENGIVSILTDEEVDIIKNMNIKDRILYLKNKDFYTTLIDYVVDITNDYMDVRTYLLNDNYVDELYIEAYNDDLVQKADIRNIHIERTNNTFILTTSTLSNSAFKNLPDTDVGAVLRLKLLDSEEHIYIKGQLSGVTNANERTFKFLFNTNFDLDKKDGLLLLDLPYPDTVSKVDLNNDASIYFYINSSTVPTNNFYLNKELEILGCPYMNVLSKENFKLNLGTRLKNIWTKSRLSYSENKYLKYGTDIYAYYEEDVYKINPTTGTIFNLKGNNEIDIEILHYKGEPILDSEGKHIIKHKAGDVILSSTGEPIVDKENAINLHFDLILTDLSFALSTRQSYIDHYRNTVRLLKQWVNEELEELNKNLIELTKVQFSPISKSGIIKIGIKNGETLYVDSKYNVNVDVFVRTFIKQNVNEVNNIKISIIDNIVKYLQRDKLVLTELKKIIKDDLKENIEGLKISGIKPLDDYEYVTILNKDERFSINLLLDYDGVNTYTKYDIDFNFITID